MARSTTWERVMGKRMLSFQGLSEVRAELDRLSKGKVTTTGTWSAFQIYNHCAEEVERVVGDAKMYPWIIRFLFANAMRRKFLHAGRYIPSALSSRKGSRLEGSERLALARYRKAIDSFLELRGTTATHPFYGRIPKDECEKLLAYHQAHHLGFLTTEREAEKESAI
jgi:hypothetical protein